MMDLDLLREFAAKPVLLVNVAKLQIQTATAKWATVFIRELVMSELALPLKDAREVADYIINLAQREIYEEGLTDPA